MRWLTARLDPVLRRLRSDFRLAILTLFGLVACLGILPFLVYRYLQGNPAVAIADTLIILGISSLVGYAWKSGRTNLACLGVVCVYTFGGLFVATRLGQAGVLWMYPVLLTNYLLVDRPLATAASVFSLIALPVAGVFAHPMEALSFLVTGAIVCAFSFIFAYRTDTQRVQLEDLACHDPLTGTYNRRALERELRSAFESHRRYGTSCGLAILDIDHFKQINDRYGHEAGDMVLVDFARLIQCQIRACDRFFRSGGEEFLLLVPGTTREGLVAFCEKLRTLVVEQLHCNDTPITVSIGAAMLEGDTDAGPWMARADAALYRAKHAGRNRVEFAAAEPAPAATAIG